MLNVKLEDISDRVTFTLGGHTYTARRLGALDQLELRHLIREAKNLEEPVDDQGKPRKLTDEELTRLKEIDQESLSISARLLDDGGDGSKSMKLVESLSDTELMLLFEQLFSQKHDAQEEVSEAPEDTQTS